MRLPVLRGLVVMLAVLAGFATATSDASAAGAASGKTYLLAIGICPPYRRGIPVVVCQNAVDAVIKEFGEALEIDKRDIISLVDEKATGLGFLAAIADLRARLKPEDRLVLYLLAHGDTFGVWADYYGAPGPIAEINKDFHDPEDYLLVFWTKDEPTVPALSLAQKEWLEVDEVVDAIETLPAKVAVILESCSSGKIFGGFHRNARGSEKIDYLLVSAGAEQIANLNDGKTMPLFTQSLTNALDLPLVDTLGEAVSHARAMTTLHATAQCATMTMQQSIFPLVFPGVTVPNEATHDGMVSPPLWMCAQVPSVADFTGDMSAMRLYQ